MSGEQRPIPSGLLLIDKPADRRITSMTVCRAVKRKLEAGGCGDPNRKLGLRVGHAGTLDPLASGLLIVLVGKATRLCERLMGGEKTYLAEIDLSRESSTDDLEGQMVDHAPELAEQLAEDRSNGVDRRSRERLEELLRERFTGLIRQRPPAFSAMWVDGKRAYHMARAGKSPNLAERPVMIYKIDIVDYVFPRLAISVRCGKGTYIRSLARDIGTALTGFSGCLTSLRRTAIGPYSVANARRLNELPDALGVADLMPANDDGRDFDGA